jgi:riboflavin biosynthesis pyrimidine reductase
LDSQLRIPLQSHLFDHPKPAWIAGLSDAPLEKKTMLEAAKAQVLEFPPDHNGQVPLKDLLQELWRRGIKRLMVEGGAQVITQFLAGDFVDEVVITMAPVWIGGLPVLGNRLQRRLCDVTVERAGEDIIVWGRPE